jgi:hypothetical protein
MGTGSTAPHILNLGVIWRLVVNFTTLYFRRKEPWYTYYRRLGGFQIQSGHGGEGKVKVKLSPWSYISTILDLGTRWSEWSASRSAGKSSW